MALLEYENRSKSEFRREAQPITAREPPSGAPQPGFFANPCQ